MTKADGSLRVLPEAAHGHAGSVSPGFPGPSAPGPGKGGGSVGRAALRQAAGTPERGFSSFPSAEPAGPVLPGGGVLHPRAPGGQAPAAPGLAKPPQVLLRGQRPERQDDARPLLLRRRHRHRQLGQEEQPAQRQGGPAAPEPPPALRQEQLQSLLGGGSGAHTADSGGLRPSHGSPEATPGPRSTGQPSRRRAAPSNEDPRRGLALMCPGGCA